MNKGYTEVIFEDGAYDGGSATIRASLVMRGKLLNFNGYTYRVSSDAKNGQATILKYEIGLHPSITDYKVQLSDFHHGKNPAEPVFATTTTPIPGDASQHLKELFKKRVSALIDIGELNDLYKALEQSINTKLEQEERKALTKRVMRFLVDVENHKTPEPIFSPEITGTLEVHFQDSELLNRMRDEQPEGPSTWKGHTFKEGDSVVVAWVGSAPIIPSWQTLEDAKDTSCLEVKTYGRIILISKEMIVVAQNYVRETGSTPEQVAGTVAIPMCSVRSIQNLDEDYEY